MIYAAAAEEIEERRKAFVRKWRLRHRAVADSLEEAGDALFAFTRLPPSQWRSARTSNAIERLHKTPDSDPGDLSVSRCCPKGRLLPPFQPEPQPLPQHQAPASSARPGSPG